MTTYLADTGMHLYEFKADSDFAACEMYPDAMITRKDGRAMDDAECAAAFRLTDE